MAKTLKAYPGKSTAEIASVGSTVVRNAKTGQSVTGKGVGALKGDHLRIKKGVSLLKPIAEQAFTRASSKRKAG